MSFLVRKRFIFKGKVQGVGFRPAVFKLAKKIGLSGIVLNAPNGVIVEVEGESVQIEKFLNSLKTRQPQNAKILKIETAQLPPIGYMTFRILPSAQSGEKTVLVPPDIGICKDCEKELFNPRDRRFGYPFINCVNCGPRFSIIKDVPYDRAKTTMSNFHMCSLCEYEYSDPSSRRFHAEPNACEDCGPHLFLMDKYGRRIETLDPILKAVQFLKEGKIIGIKGLGSFQLICDATNTAAILELRKRKNIPDRPFALMAYSLKEVKSFAKVNEKESCLLLSSARPIVLLKKRKGALISDSVAPFLDNIGVTLPYSPIHFLIIKENFLSLVITEAARGSEPQVKDNEKVVVKLKDLVDFTLIHDRKIWNRCDDSIVRVIKNKVLINKRSRGYAPDPIRISNDPFNEILGTGGEDDNSFTLTRKRRAYPSQYIGKLDNLETFEFLKEAILCYETLLKVKPKIIAHDMNPDYMSVKYAKSFNGLQTVAVQHHEAHITSVMAEHNIYSEVIGVAFDSGGYGGDGTIWGGEFIAGKPGSFVRRAHLKIMPFLQKSGRESCAFAYLLNAFGEDLYKLKIDFIKKFKNEIKSFEKLIKSNAGMQYTSSVAGFFDAVYSIIGLRENITYERQSLLEMESLALGKGYKSYEFELDENLTLLPAEIIKGIVVDLKTGVPRENISYKFHNTIAKAIGKICKIISKETKIKKVCLSGDIFENSFLLEAALRELKKVRLEAYVNEKVPVNDGGLSLGQVRFAKDIIEKNQKIH